MHKVPLLKDIICRIVSFRRGESLPPATSWNLGAATRLFILAVIAKDNWKGGKTMLFRFMTTTVLYMAVKRVRT